MKYLKHPWIFLILSCIIVIVVKIPHLGFPYFFDETFSYYPAVLEMARVGPSMLPGTISLVLAKGHPLFFYFLASSWMKLIAGDSVTLMRIFPLLVALVALFVFHRFAKRHTNILLANIAVVLLAIQPLFLAQASLVLPSILIFILLMMSFDSYLSRSYGLYAFYGSLLMLTKETGAVFIMVFGLAYLIENYRNLNSKTFWRNLVLLAVPVFVYLLFLILHYHEFGVFFFSEHLDFITFNSNTVQNKFNSAVWMLFLAQGRNLVVYTAVLALIVLLFRKKEIEYRRFLIFSLSILILFLIFTSVNFFGYRYVLPVLGIVLLASLVLIQQIKTKYQALNIAYIVCILSVSAYYSATKRGQSDVDLGYTQYLVVHQQMVKYCEQQSWYDKEIGGGYNMVMSLRERCAKYLSTDKNFKTNHLPGLENRDIIIYDSTCWPVEMPESEKSKLTLIKRIEYKNHWGEIYSTSSAKEATQPIQKQTTVTE